MNWNKFISLITSTIGCLTISQLILINSAHGFTVNFSNSGFEDPIGGGLQNSWDTIGDVQHRGDLDVVTPTAGDYQAAITTGYTPGTSSGFDRNDDNNLNFNLSGIEPVSADTNSDGDLLQAHIGLNTNAFSIDRSAGAIFPGTRTSKEGSGMYQDFTVTLEPGETSFTVSFDWAFLSNDGTTSDGGNQDFAFWSLGQVDGSIYTTTFDSADTSSIYTNNNPTPNNEIIVLRESDTSPSYIENISSPTTQNDYLYEFDYDDPNNSRETYTVTGLTGGQTYNYRLGYGVVDVDGLERTSTLLVDNVEVIPFEFSPSFGLIIVAGTFGLCRLSKKIKNNG